MNIKKIFLKFKKPPCIDISRGNLNIIHECGHALVTYLFEEEFEIKYITTLETLLRSFDPLSKGGIVIHFDKSKMDNPDLITKYLYILFGGYCAQNIFDNRFEKISYRDLVTKSANNGCDGDLELIQPLLSSPVMERYFYEIKITPHEFCEYLIVLIKQYLASEEIKRAILFLAIRIISEQGQKLSGTDIVKILRECLFEKCIKKHKKRLI